MKKIRYIAFLAIVVISIVSCGTQKKVTGPKQDVNSVQGSLYLHPVQVDIPTTETVYSTFLDARNKVIYITEDSLAYQTFAEYLPEIMIPGRMILLEGAIIDPFVIFTEEEFEGLKTKMAKLGVDLNGYKVARLFAYGLTTSANTQTRTTTTEVKKNDVPTTPVRGSNKRSPRTIGKNDY
jgi:hypothetical protein